MTKFYRFLSLLALFTVFACAGALEDESDESSSESSSADASAELRSGFTVDGDELECKVIQDANDCEVTAEQQAYVDRCKDSGLASYTCGCNQSICSAKLPEPPAAGDDVAGTDDGATDGETDGGEEEVEKTRNAPDSFTFCKDLLEFIDDEPFTFDDHLYKWRYDGVRSEQAIDICAELGEEWRLPTAGESGGFIKIAKLVKKDSDEDLMYCGIHFWSQQKADAKAYIYRPYALNWFAPTAIDKKASTLCIKAPPPEQQAEKCANARGEYLELLQAMNAADNSCQADADCGRGQVPGLLCAQKVITYNISQLADHEGKLDGLAKVIADSCWVDNLTDVMCPAVAYPSVIKCVENECMTSFGGDQPFPNGFPAP